MLKFTFDKRDVHLDEAGVRAARQAYRQLLFDAENIKDHTANIHFVLAIKDNGYITYHADITTDNEDTRLFVIEFIDEYVSYPSICDLKNLPRSLTNLVAV